MPRKSIYVRDADLDLYQWFELTHRESLSSFLARKLEEEYRQQPNPVTHPQ